MDPTNTPVTKLFEHIGKNRLGYRIVIQNLAAAAKFDYMAVALENGMMPFAPQGDNNPSMRYDEPPGLKAAVAIAGGARNNTSSYGPGVEFIDALPRRLSSGGGEDAAQSWANQVVAAKFARILDEHPEYNIWDARQHLRQTGSSWQEGWNEKIGYGRPDLAVKVERLLPGAPLEFRFRKSSAGHFVTFDWRNFPQSDWAGTVITRRDGRVIYDGTGTNFVWASDVDGDESFTYFSKNKRGERSRTEIYQIREATGLRSKEAMKCLVLGVPPTDENCNPQLRQVFSTYVTNWDTFMAYRPGNTYKSAQTQMPQGPVAAVLPDFPAMVDYAISNNYRMIIVPANYSERDPYAHKASWDRATAAGVLVVAAHNGSLATSRKPEARRLSPPFLSSAITVGAGYTNNLLSFGPGLEFFDAPASPGILFGGLTQTEAAAVVAGKLARVLETNPSYNNWDARQHLRQSSSLYRTGWVEDGGFGKPPEQPATLASLDAAPPLEIKAEKSADSHSVVLSWANFLQSSYAATVIQRGDGQVLYEGRGTNYVWKSDIDGEETFRFFSRNKAGGISRPETFTIQKVSGLKSKL
jgi:hypothetical protein